MSVSRKQRFVEGWRLGHTSRDLRYGESTRGGGSISALKRYHTKQEQKIDNVQDAARTKAGGEQKCDDGQLTTSCSIFIKLF